MSMSVSDLFKMRLTLSNDVHELNIELCGLLDIILESDVV